MIVLADDLGYGDLGCYDHPRLLTPKIDQFAAEGLKLTACYAAAANCSPSRTGLMTGRTPFRVGVYNWIAMFSPMHVRREEITIATLLRNGGYDTCHVGKWHLNGQFNLPSQPQPWDHGFNYWFSTQNNALPNHRNPTNFVRNGRDVGPLEGYSARLVADEAIRWLQEERDPAKPFFLFVCFHEPHEPIASASKFTDLYPDEDASLSAHHGNITQLDAAFGSLVESLDRLDLRKDTLVFFTSDNGPAITRMHPHGSAGPLRGKKGCLYEGGIRVPGILQWPGHIRPGTTSDEPVSGVDVLPTLCEIAAIDAPADRVLDGASITAVLRGEPIQRAKPLYWQFNRSSDDMKVALRDGDWKLLAKLTGPAMKPSGGIAEEEMQIIKSAELSAFELYNLRSDLAETADVGSAHPRVLEQLREGMQQIYSEVRDEGPIWPAWEFARYEAERIEWPDYWRNDVN
jgi:arylsulfatase A